MPETVELPISIEGMHCGGCVNRVTAALKRLDGVDVRSVAAGSALVAFDPEMTSKEEILEAINRIGFTARGDA
ncbi:MAG: heavy-metal-associated domain-containing protein [Bryobacterales bacterium]|nr:heavy-metal-associated domain-containing protein [Bryobacterales bacterium]